MTSQSSGSSPQNNAPDIGKWIVIFIAGLTLIGGAYGAGVYQGEKQQASEVKALTNDKDKLEKNNKDLQDKLDKSSTPSTKSKIQDILNSSAGNFDAYSTYYNFDDRGRQVGINLLLSPEGTKKISALSELGYVQVGIRFEGRQNTVKLCLKDKNDNEDCQLLNSKSGTWNEKNNERLIPVRLDVFRIDKSSIVKINFDAQGIGPQQSAGKNKSGFTLTKVDFK